MAEKGVSMDYTGFAHAWKGPQSLSVFQGGESRAFKLVHMNLSDRKTREPLRPWKEHCHEVYHIALYLKGEGRFLLDGRLTPCRRGSLVLCSPGQPHDFGPEGDGLFEFAEITFTMESSDGSVSTESFHSLVEALFGQRFAPLAWPADLDEWRTRQLFGLMESMAQALFRTNERGDAPVCSAVMKIFLFLLDNVFLPSSPAPSSDAGIALLRARDRIEHGFGEKLSLASLAKGCKMAPGYFCRRFKAAFGVSPIELALRSRIEAAKGLLSSTEMSCKEVAAQTGFASLVFFSRVFRRRCGVSPANWRKAVSKAQSRSSSVLHLGHE